MPWQEGYTGSSGSSTFRCDACGPLQADDLVDQKDTVTGTDLPGTTRGNPRLPTYHHNSYPG
jgi:hypothetical protein